MSWHVLVLGLDGFNIPGCMARGLHATSCPATQRLAGAAACMAAHVAAMGALAGMQVQTAASGSTLHTRQAAPLWRIQAQHESWRRGLQCRHVAAMSGVYHNDQRLQCERSPCMRLDPCWTCTWQFAF